MLLDEFVHGFLEAFLHFAVGGWLGFCEFQSDGLVLGRQDVHAWDDEWYTQQNQKMLVLVDDVFENGALFLVVSETQRVYPDECTGHELFLDWKYSENSVQVTEIGCF